MAWQLEITMAEIKAGSPTYSGRRGFVQGEEVNGG